jgi:DNA-directed RNA polymerase subunit RPC12/RpoP
MTADKICVVCSAPFKRSPADRTVRCPACRKRDRAVAAPAAAMSKICRCGKTVFVDAFGHRTPSATCPVCDEHPPA